MRRGPDNMKKPALRALFAIMPLLLAAGCANVNVPGGRSVSVPTVTPPADREQALNELRDPITRVRLGKDVLVPHRSAQDPLPSDDVGPFELRGETLASALQLVLDDYDISLAFESDLAMTTRISVANLHGPVSKVVGRMCDLANLYCSFNDGVLTVKDTETFVVDMPPIGTMNSSGTSGGTTGSTGGTSGGTTTGGTGTTSSGGSSSGAWGTYEQITDGLAAIVGGTPTIDETTRVLIYTATQRTQKHAARYFESLRKNTALIIFETNIWEVALDNENRTGIDWNSLLTLPNLGLRLELPGGAPDGAASPITITPTYTGSNKLDPTTVLEFISEQGTVKTVSQPQLTVLSGSTATLEVQQAENFLSGVQRTPSTTPGVADTVSTTTQTVQTGLVMSVSGAWDKSSIYGMININLNELLALDTFKPDVNTTIQLPRTNSRTLSTQIRVRPGDSILVGGLVTQKDNYTASGPGFMKPLFPTARSAIATNTELVFLLRPRVVVFVPGDEEDTPPIAVAPRQDAAAGDITQQVDSLFGRISGDGAADRGDDRPVALPGGLSASALAPEAEGRAGNKDAGKGEGAPPMPDTVLDMAPMPLAKPAAADRAKGDPNP